jgi:leader peptidase (prepilin peptidase)/N-methyltransferase
VLGVPDLVPVFSWLFLMGKCRHCGGAIPLRSLGLEVAFVVMGALLVWWWLL